LLLCPLAQFGQSGNRATPQQLAQIREYIKRNWQTLKRSNQDLAKAAPDPKMNPGTNGRWPVYISSLDNKDAIVAKLKNTMSAPDFASLDFRILPAGARSAPAPGLLYLPNPYVVPGGRFNEMYGWDSYFIQVGLLRDGEIDLAKNMIDNFLYEIDKYGMILNANRSYYLTRSQPPFLTEMILGVYNQTHDKTWLAKTIPAIEKYYRLWTTQPHLTASGLSRYYDFGEGPAPEVLAAERDEKGLTHYDRVRDYFRSHPVTDFDVRLYYNRANDSLTNLYYKSDRSMRESGFDPSNRFGPFNADCIHYNPVDLNSLLYQMEIDAAEISTQLGNSHAANLWRSRANRRRMLINRLMWDFKEGLYFDYNFQTNRVRHYPFITTFFPLWAGIASKDQAALVAANLRLFEREGGLMTSTFVSGSQWDAPYGWAPTEMIAVKGLRRYGLNDEADRVTINFLSTILKEYLRTGTILEKYDVVKRAAEVKGLEFGYKSNEIGFGWTNAAFEELYSELPEDKREFVLNLAGISN
jgi:alpha,alpha-trehalase